MLWMPRSSLESPPWSTRTWTKPPHTSQMLNFVNSHRRQRYTVSLWYSGVQRTDSISPCLHIPDASHKTKRLIVTDFHVWHSFDEASNFPWGQWIWKTGSTVCMVSGWGMVSLIVCVCWSLGWCTFLKHVCGISVTSLWMIKKTDELNFLYLFHLHN